MNKSKITTRAAYRQGFINKCAEYDIDPVKLVKAAFPVGGLMTAGKALVNGARWLGRFSQGTVGKTLIGGGLGAAAWKKLRNKQNQPIAPKPAPVIGNTVESIANYVSDTVPGYLGTRQRFYQGGQPIGR